LTTVPERAADWRWRIGVGVLLLASGTAVVMMKVDGPVIFAGLVFRRWHLVGVLFGAGIGFLFASWGLRLRPEWDRPQRSPGRRFAVGAFGAGAVVVAGFLFFFTEHLDAAIGYTVLTTAADSSSVRTSARNRPSGPTASRCFPPGSTGLARWTFTGTRPGTRRSAARFMNWSGRVTSPN
jgi:hypothetical protein